MLDVGGIDDMAQEITFMMENVSCLNGGPEKGLLKVRIKVADDLLLLLGLLGQKNSLDVGQDTTLGNGHPGEQLVQLFVVSDGQLQVTGNDTRLLVVTGGVAGQLEHLSGQVLHDGGQVDGCAGTDALGVVALAQMAMDTTDGELKSGTARSGLGLSLGLASLSATSHD